MANVMDYLDWRGDLTLRQSPFNDVDNLILAELSFLDFEGVVPPPEEDGSVALADAAEALAARTAGDRETDMGVLVPDVIPEMFFKMARTPRFRDMRLRAYRARLDTERAEQFAAVAVECGDGAVYLSFRGTDDTLAGWKEDFYLACSDAVGAQREAAAYAAETARRCPRKKLRLGGHSKGGNLAVYAAVFLPKAIQKRVETVWSNDGPGFGKDVLPAPRHARVAPKIRTIVPQSSLVGMLLEHEEDYAVVESSQKGLWQHDGFSWEVR
ncbi:MAG: DUF2974 domain-containing protein, partial [Oscillibacter sp.]|nr:DUF2974 domain-containing protein [Oscillibacter sp.]